MTARAKRLRQIEKALFPEVLPVKVAQLCDAALRKDVALLNDVVDWVEALSQPEFSEFCGAVVLTRPVSAHIFRLWCNGDLGFEGAQEALEAVAKFEERKGNSFAAIRADGEHGNRFGRVEKAVGRILARYRKNSKGSLSTP